MAQNKIESSNVSTQTAEDGEKQKEEVKRDITTIEEEAEEEKSADEQTRMGGNKSLDKQPQQPTTKQMESDGYLEKSGEKFPAEEDFYTVDKTVLAESEIVLADEEANDYDLAEEDLPAFKSNRDANNSSDDALVISGNVPASAMSQSQFDNISNTENEVSLDEAAGDISTAETIATGGTYRTKNKDKSKNDLSSTSRPLAKDSQLIGLLYTAM